MFLENEWIFLKINEYFGIPRNIPENPIKSRNIPENQRIFTKIKEYSGKSTNIQDNRGIFRKPKNI